MHDGFHWHAKQRVLFLDPRMSEAEMIVTLARALRLIVGRDD